MKHKRLSVLLIATAVIFVGGAVLCAVMTIRAVQHSEWGRVLVYGFSGMICIEALIVSVVKYRNKDNT